MENENENFPSHLNNLLLKRKEQKLFRQLNKNINVIDFCSNDYFGLSKIDLGQDVQVFGSGGSRLISGNSKEAEDCEIFLATFFR